MSVRIGYHASHEQHPPSALLRSVRHAEQAGFSCAMCSDHFAPWSARQGQSGFAWTWLGAALQSTTFDFGTVTAPGQRYHPAIVAQAAATIGEMFPDRLFVALGTGEALNEHITGDVWPTKSARRARLRECVDVIRALFRGETVTHEGLVRVREAKLYTLPKTAPMLVGAAVTEATAGWVAGWADGLITVSKPLPELRRTIEAFREGGGNGKPVFVQHALAFGVDDAEAARSARERWGTNLLGSSELLSDLSMPEHFDAAAKFLRDEDVRQAMCVSADPRVHAEHIAAFLELGIDRVYLHHVGLDQARFIDVFGARVLPELTSSSEARSR